MKKYFLVAAFLGLSALSYAQLSSADSLSMKIAQRMKDSLELNNSQQSFLYQVNRILAQQKANAWVRYEGQDSLLRINIQRIENTRDSLYRPVLGEEKYVLYKEKKPTLINNN